MNPPKVSVVVPSYNHASYISEALESVVQQNFKDVEMLILDDASSDGSVDAIQQFSDRHPDVILQFSRHESNQGGVITLNHLISMASGEYIALINSDDVWLPGKLERQVSYLDQHTEIGAVFTQATIVDENKQALTKESFLFSNVFIQKNRPRGSWLRRFFFEQNCLCHPSILIRKSVYSQVGTYDPRFRQVPDLQMWVRLLKQVDLFLIEEPLVLLRWHASNTNQAISGNKNRGINELFYLYRDFFDDIPDEILRDGFSDLFTHPTASSPEELACEKVFLYFTQTNHIRSLYYNIGLEKLYGLLGNPVSAETLKEKYNFGYEDFFRLGGSRFFDEEFFYSLGLMTQSPVPPAGPQGSDGEIIRNILGNRLRRLLGKSPPLYRILRSANQKLRGKPE